MPVVLTDYTNKVWCVEQPDDGLLHVGLTGAPGPTLVDALEFLETRRKQFDKFIEKKREKENATRRPRVRKIGGRALLPETRGNPSPRED